MQAAALHPNELCLSDPTTVCRPFGGRRNTVHIRYARGTRLSWRRVSTWGSTVHIVLPRRTCLRWRRVRRSRGRRGRRGRRGARRGTVLARAVDGRDGNGVGLALAVELGDTAGPGAGA